MNIAVEAPELSRALVALERELRIDPVLRELVKLRASMPGTGSPSRPARPSATTSPEPA